MSMMNTETNSFSKSQLAKLLATENISFRHDPTAKTAHFDIKNRELVLPVWRNVSEDLYDMLVVHEVGHALDTPLDGWINGIKSIAKKLHGDKVSPRAERAIKNFLNIVEDARIDKRQKRRYPGAKRNYVIGYKELIARDFFGTASRDLNTYSFIDRANIYFKGGAMMGIKFNSEERKFIKAMEEAETFDDALLLTEKIYAWAKSKGQDQSATSLTLTEDEEGEDGDEFGISSREADDSDEADDQEEGAGEDGEEGEEGEESSDSDEADDSDKTGKSHSYSDGSGSGDDDFIPESVTENEFEQNVTSIVMNVDQNYIYLDTPVAILDRIVHDYKRVLAENMAMIKMQSVQWQTSMHEKVRTFKSQERRTISYMVKEFEQRKAAELYAKTAIAKTGVINTNKLHSYRYNDDIFRRVTTTPQGKNHGFVMFLDWSGSMYGNMDATIKQLISLTMFCKQVQIPFEVYSFRDMRHSEYDDKFCGPNGYEQFTHTKNCLDVGGGFVLRNLLSSRMTPAELNSAYMMLMSWQLLRNVELLGGTPLNAAIIAAEQIVNEFRKKNRIEIMNTIFLTDGDSDVSNPNRIDRVQYPWRHAADRYIIRDNVTKKEYQMNQNPASSDKTTEVLLSILKDRTRASTVGFFLASNPIKSLMDRFYGHDTTIDRQKIVEHWRENNFIPVKSQGYDEYFVVKASSMAITEDVLVVDPKMTQSKILKSFVKYSEAKTVNRILLRQFMEIIAKHRMA